MNGASAADYRRQADRAREHAADARQRGAEEQARRFERMADACDDAAHLLDLDPAAVIDLDEIAAARDPDEGVRA